MSNYNNQYAQGDNFYQNQTNQQTGEVPYSQAYADQQQGQQGAGYTTNVYVNAQVIPTDNYQMTETDRILRLVAFIFNLISTISCAIVIIPLAWMIPMTITSYKIYKGTKPNTTAFGVCTLLFLNFISGILLLCSTKNAR